MQQIVLIAPNEEIATSAREAERLFGTCMDVEVGTMQDGVERARECMRRTHPPKVLLSRGGTALLLQAQLDIPVIEIKMLLPDAVSALVQARRYGDKILFLGFANHINGVSGLNTLIDIEIQEIVLEDWLDIKDVLARAKRDGFDAVIGGAMQQKVAAELGIPFVFLSTGPAAIHESYLQAKALLDALLVEERKTQEIRTILNDTRDGFISIDKSGKITLANRAVGAMLGKPVELLLGSPLAAAAPPLARLSAALSGSHEKDDIIAIGQNSFLLQQTPLKHQDEIIGAMAILKNVRSVKKDESKIRLKQYEDGLHANYRFPDIVGNSASLAVAKRQAAQYAKVDSTVLIVSESGTGKEMFAQSIHNASPRGEGPFVAINCASLTSSILESELFGYVDGAFTGAKKGGKAGVFEMANNGTIFLDEIGELPPDIQGKLLRVLQERCIMRLGATRIVPVDVRVIAATNRNLVEDVKKKQFRKDLFFRLDVLRLTIPPLRERREDIPVLCELFLGRYGAEQSFALEKRTVDALTAHTWPGNIRELENIMERLCVGGPQDAHDTVLRHFDEMEQLAEHAEPPKAALRAERVRDALLRSKGNKRRAAELLGVHRSTLYRFLNEYGDDI